MKLPTKIVLTSGIGIGKTRLNAFDNALLNAGAGNFNLSPVSSVIPPKAKIIYLSKNNSKKLLPRIGSIVPVVYSCVYGEKPDEKIAATLALGVPKSYNDHNGLIFEFAAENITKNEAEKVCQEMIKEAFQERGLKIGKIQFVSTECIVKEKITCAIAIALMI